MCIGASAPSYTPPPVVQAPDKTDVSDKAKEIKAEQDAKTDGADKAVDASDPKVREARASARQRAASTGKNRSGTILTDPQGLLDEPDTAKKTVLGA